MTSLYSSVHSDSKCDVKSKIRLRQSMRMYLKNNRAKFHPDPFANDGVFKGGPNKKKKDKVSSDLESVPDPKIT